MSSKSGDTEKIKSPALTSIGPVSLLSAPFVMLCTIYHKRQLVKYFVKRDLAVKYNSSILGYFWSLIEPLVLTATFYILFQILVDDKDEWRTLNIMIGILLWKFFASTTQSSTMTLSKNAELIKGIYIPRELFVFHQLFFELVILLLSLLICIPLMIAYGLIPGIRVLYIPFCILNICMLATGIGMCLAPLQPRIKDIQHLVSLSLRVSFYLTPVFYTLDFMSRVPQQYMEIYLLVNPMAIFITLMRSGFTNQPPPVGWENIAFSCAISVVIFIIGSIIYMRGNFKAVKYL